MTPDQCPLLTVDCGISDVAAVARARELGFTVVISDHHLPPAELPDAQAVTNPRIGENPCPHLAGVGVAFFLMAALNARLEKLSGKKLDMRKVLDLVALGTLADMVSLTGQNRILVKNGLLAIAEARRPGLACPQGGQRLFSGGLAWGRSGRLQSRAAHQRRRQTGQSRAGPRHAAYRLA